MKKGIFFLAKRRKKEVYVCKAGSQWWGLTYFFQEWGQKRPLLRGERKSRPETFFCKKRKRTLACTTVQYSTEYSRVRTEREKDKLGRAEEEEKERRKKCHFKVAPGISLAPLSPLSLFFLPKHSPKRGGKKLFSFPFSPPFSFQGRRCRLTKEREVRVGGGWPREKEWL